MQECGECTACCYAFAVDAIGKEQHTKCPHANAGCDIYENRPDVCRKYLCAWVTQPKVHIDLRPDKCGIIFTKIGDNVMLIEQLRSPTPVGRQQILEFRKQGYEIKYAA